MQRSHSVSFLRRVLLVDAACSATMGIALLAFGSMLAPVLGLPEQLLREAGIALLPFAAFVGYLASQQQPSRIGVWIVIALNSIWAIDGIALLFTDWVAPSGLGTAFVIAQALVVGAFAELEYVGIRRSKLVVAQ